jgi:biopolymer transport protein TolQ
MDQKLSVINLVLHASWIVQCVIAMLLASSVASWAIIFAKRSLLRRSRADADQFESSFWSGGELTSLYRAIEARDKTGGMESIFAFGFREFARLRQQGGIAPEMLLDGARRAMRVAQLKEIDRLEQSLATLATIGSMSPYVGLFGTVWGIMNAFTSLGTATQATLQAVAPGIAESLVATAIGLFVAIPAGIAYNRFADQVSRLEMRYDGFMEEFSSLLQRHATVSTD